MDLKIIHMQLKFWIEFCLYNVQSYIRLVVRKLERRPRHSKKLNVVFQPKIFSFFSWLSAWEKI